MVKPKIENETKREKFKRIASSRVNRILNDIRLLGNCSNTSSYDYYEEDIKKIFNAIDSELRKVKIMFDRKKTKKIEL
jgi:hypothetical protein